MPDLICGLRLCSAEFIRVGGSESGLGGGGRAGVESERLDERCEGGPDDRQALEQFTDVGEELTRIDVV